MSDSFMDTYNRYLPAVTRFARRFASGDRDLADDLMQEGWLALLRLPETRWPQERYVYTVLCRAMRHWLRRERALAVLHVETRQTQPNQRHVEVEVIPLHPDERDAEAEDVHLRPRLAA